MSQLEVKAVNLLINRRIGDEQLPEDSERKLNGFDQGTLKVDAWPQWIQEGKPSPAGRFTIVTWRQWKKTDPLAESGLLGPVTLRAMVETNLWWTLPQQTKQRRQQFADRSNFR